MIISSNDLLLNALKNLDELRNTIQLLQTQMSPSIDSSIITGLIVAVQNSNVAEAKRLLDLYPSLVDTRSPDGNKETLLMIATRKNSLGMVNLLISKRASLNLQSDNSKDTALLIASWDNRSSIVKALLEAGADQFIPQANNILPLESAISSTSCGRLIANNPDVVNIYKAYNENLINKPMLNTKSFKNTCSSFETFVQYINYGLKPSSVDLSNMNLNGSNRSLLMATINQLNISAATKLLDLGAKTTTRNTSFTEDVYPGFSARQWAIETRNQEMINLMNSRP